MGLRFDLSVANWVAYLTDPQATLPEFDESWKKTEALRVVLEKLSRGFYSSTSGVHEFLHLAESAQLMLDSLEARPAEGTVANILADLRRFLSDRPWTALIIPSGQDQGSDQYLSSEEFLVRLVRIRPGDPGLILQIEEMPNTPFALMDIFPAFRTALADSIHWPGILVWTSPLRSVFLPVPSTAISYINEAANWIFSHLSEVRHLGPGVFLSQYRKMFPRTVPSKTDSIHFIQLSDLHIGSKEAGVRIPRVQQLVRNLKDELGDRSTIIPVVTGDLLDDPNEDYLDGVRAFLDFLSNLDVNKPAIVLGNHDVREDGYLSENFRIAMGIPTERVAWFDDSKVALVCFNSVMGGELAQGSIGERQLVDLANEIERKKGWRDFVLVGALHHHPIRIEPPDWYVKPFYEKFLRTFLGSWFDKTTELKDAKQFLKFVNDRGFTAILHGHEHIPRVPKQDDPIPVFGCGSSTGKVRVKQGGTFMAINVISLDLQRGQLSGRLLAEESPGGGLNEHGRHEALFRRHLPMSRS